MNAKRGIIVLGLLSAASMPTWAQQIKGVVIDQKSKETLIGAVVTVDGTNVKAITNIDGNFQIDGLNKDKKYTLYINYIGYKTQKIDGVQAKDADQVIALQPDEQQLKEVTVTAVERRNTDAAMIQVAKNSPVIVSNVSAQEISRTQDTNAGEVIRRVPGVSLIDDKFVMVRGLSGSPRGASGRGPSRLGDVVAPTCPQHGSGSPGTSGRHPGLGHGPSRPGQWEDTAGPRARA